MENINQLILAKERDPLLYCLFATHTIMVDKVLNGDGDEEGKRSREIVRQITAPGITTEERNVLYRKWAEKYDEDLSKVVYNGPRQQVEGMLRFANGDQNMKMLDLACGTGLAAEILHKFGCTNVDGIDCSEEMLAVARSKNVYKNLICDYLGENRLSIADNTYDILGTNGSFVEGHLNHTCFPELIRITKPGGYIVLLMGFSYLETVPAYRGILEPQMRQLEQDKQWRMLLREIVPNYREKWSKDVSKENAIENNSDGILFVFQIL